MNICHGLKNAFAHWYTAQEHSIWLRRTKLKQLEIIIDIPKGGKMAFQQLRDDTNPPIHAIHYGKEATLVRTRCSKEGSDSFKVKPGHSLCQGPIQLQDQHAQVLQVQEIKFSWIEKSHGNHPI